MKRRTFVAASAGALAALPLRGMARDTKTLRVRFGSDMSNVDPARIFQIENQTIAENIYNGLLKYDQKTNKLVPDLARSMQISSDGKIYTFHLRPGVKWHKGYGTFTADDVKYSMERILDPAASSSYAGQFADVERIEAVDPATARVTLKKRNAGFTNKIAAWNQGWIVNRKAVTELGDKYPTSPIGTGPFMFDKWTPGTGVDIVANPEYFAGKPALERVAFILIKDETATAVALQNGEIDVAFAINAPEVIQRLKAAQGITVVSRDANNTMNLVLNTTVKPLDDRRVRQAIMYAINRKGLQDDFFKGLKGEAYSVLTSTFPEFTKDVPTYPHNPAKAKALLAEAKVPTFQLELVSLGLHPYDQIIVPIANDLNAVGIKTNITILERGAYLQARQKGDIATCITGLVGPPDPDSPLVSLYATKAFPPGLNTAHYSGVDDLLERADAELDAKKRNDIYRQILRKTMTDVPVIPLYAEKVVLAYSNAVHGLVQNTFNTLEVYPIKLS